MAGKHADIRELAGGPTPGASDVQDAPERRFIDPVSPTALVLHLSEIKPYEHNPRHAENPEYFRLKDSIRARRGLTTPLTVTKRPGDQFYTIAAGGNSRLMALNELYEETREEVFNRVTCRFEPWDSDCRVLASHLIENDVRGNITFADKARAIVHWCELYEQAHPSQGPLTQRELAVRLGECGFQVSQASLSRFLYAAEYLMPHLPKAFASGIGREPVERLIRLRTLAEQYWRDTVEATNVRPDLSFDRVFEEVCAGEDRHRESWSYELFASALAQQIAEALHLGPKLVALDLENLLHGVPLTKVPVPASLEDVAGSSDGWVFEREREHLKEQIERQRARAEERAQREAQSPSPTQSESSEEIHPELPSGCSPAELKRWREWLCAKAFAVAERQGLRYLVRECDIGYGFFIDPPDPSPAAGAGEPESTATNAPIGTVAWTWWWLAAIAQQLAPAHLAAIAFRQPDAWFVQLFCGGSQHLDGADPRAALEVLVPPPDLAGLAEEFLIGDELSHEEFEALEDLTRSCRILFETAACFNVALWD